MNKIKVVAISLLLAVASYSAVADNVFYGNYDPVDAYADREIAAINAQEYRAVEHELREGDFREAQQVIQRDEAIKYEIRRENALYDVARDRTGYTPYYYDND